MRSVLIYTVRPTDRQTADCTLFPATMVQFPAILHTQSSFGLWGWWANLTTQRATPNTAVKQITIVGTAPWLSTPWLTFLPTTLSGKILLNLFTWQAKEQLRTWRAAEKPTVQCWHLICGLQFTAGTAVTLWNVNQTGGCQPTRTPL